MKKIVVLTGAGFSSPFLKFDSSPNTEYGKENLNTSFLDFLIQFENEFFKFLDSCGYNLADGNTKSILNVYQDIKTIQKLLGVGYQKKPIGFEEIIHLLEIITPQGYSTIRNELRVSYPKEYGNYRYSREPDNAIELEANPRELKLFKDFILKVIALFKIQDDKQVETITTFFNSLTQKNNVQFYSLNYDDLIFQAYNKSKHKNPFLIYSGYPNGSGKEHYYHFIHGGVLNYNDGSHITACSNIDDAIQYRDKFEYFFSGKKEKAGWSQLKDNKQLSSNFNYFISGIDKQDKLQFEPYNSIFLKFIEDVFSCDELLVIGYSFSDKHINNVLKKVTAKVKHEFTDVKKIRLITPAMLSDKKLKKMVVVDLVSESGGSIFLNDVDKIIKRILGGISDVIFSVPVDNPNIRNLEALDFSLIGNLSEANYFTKIDTPKNKSIALKMDKFENDTDYSFEIHLEGTTQYLEQTI